MIWFTVTGPPVVEPFTYTASGSTTNSGSNVAINTQDEFTITTIGETSQSNSQSVVTSSNGDVLQTNQGEGYSFFASTLQDSSLAPEEYQTETTQSNSDTGLQSWNGRVINSDITSVKSRTTNYSWNTGYVTQVYTFAIATEGGQDTESATAITGTVATTTTNTSGDPETVFIASTTSTTQSYNRTLNESAIESEGTTYVSAALPPITMWQTTTAMALRVSSTVPYQNGASTIVSTQYGGHTYTQSFTSEVANQTRSFVPITDTVGDTGYRGTYTVVIIPNGETLWVPTATGVREASNLCQSFAGPQVRTLSGVYSTRGGLVVNGSISYSVTQQIQTLTRTVTTATLSVQTTLGFGTNTYTTEGNYKTRTISADGIIPGGNPTAWQNPWPMRDNFAAFNPIPAEIVNTITEAEIVTTTTTESIAVNNYGNTPVDTAIAWKTVYVNTQTPESTWQSTFYSFVTETNTRRYANFGENSEEIENENEGTTINGVFGNTWIEHRPLFVREANSNNLYATITYESFAQAPLSALDQRAKKVSLNNTTVSYWQPAAAGWSVDFVAAAFPQTFSIEDTSQNKTTSGSLWADGYSETIYDQNSFTSTSASWVAGGAPETSWVQVGGFGKTGMNQRGDRWTRVRPPNILQQVDSSGNKTPVTHQSLSAYAATAVENYESAFVVEVNSTGGFERFVAQLA